MQSRLDDDLLSDGRSFKSGIFEYASRAQESPYWNIFFLAIAWALTLTTSTLLTSVAPLTAKDLGASQSISAFTIGCFLIGAAVSSVPSGAIFRKYGRMKGFSGGCFCQLVGSILGVLSILGSQLWVLFLGCFAIGLGQGLGQFYRFSAVEVSPEYLKSRAVTYVLSGGILAAFLGPTCATYSATLIHPDYVASFGLIAIIAVLNQIVVLCVNFPPPVVPKQVLTSEVPNALVASALGEDSAIGNRTHSDVNKSGGIRMSNVTSERQDSVASMRIRTPWEIITQPMFIVSTTVATLAHTVMVMIMSNVTIAMDDSGYSFSKGSLTLELHFLAMFSPGFFTGSLIERYGTFTVAFLGAIIFAMSSFVLAIGDEFWNYSVGMVLSGLGWNFAFSAGTVMLTSCYKPVEAAHVQAYNDFIIFSVAGGGSLISGVIYAAYGWLVLIYVVSGLMVVYFMLFAVMWKYAPADAETGEEEDEAGPCCSLLSGSAAQGAGAAEGRQADRSVSEDPEDGAAMSGQFGSGYSGGVPNRPTLFDVPGAPGYNYSSRHSSFASATYENSSRKNSIAEVGVRIQF